METDKDDHLNNYSLEMEQEPKNEDPSNMSTETQDDSLSLLATSKSRKEKDPEVAAEAGPLNVSSQSLDLKLDETQTQSQLVDREVSTHAHHVISQSPETTQSQDIEPVLTPTQTVSTIDWDGKFGKLFNTNEAGTSQVLQSQDDPDKRIEEDEDLFSQGDGDSFGLPAVGSTPTPMKRPIAGVQTTDEEDSPRKRVKLEEDDEDRDKSKAEVDAAKNESSQSVIELSLSTNEEDKGKAVGEKSVITLDTTEEDEDEQEREKENKDDADNVAKNQELSKDQKRFQQLAFLRAFQEDTAKKESSTEEIAQEKEKAKKEAQLTLLRIAHAPFTSDDNNSAADLNSEPIFTKVQSRRDSRTLTSTTSNSEFEVTQPMTPREPGQRQRSFQSLADDEASSSMTVQPMTSKDTSGLNPSVNLETTSESPNLSVSPISSAIKANSRASIQSSSRKATSTPGLRSSAAKKRSNSRPKKLAGRPSEVLTSDDEERDLEQKKRPSPKKQRGEKDQPGTFKVPEEAVYTAAIGPLSREELDQLKKYFPAKQVITARSSRFRWDELTKQLNADVTSSPEPGASNGGTTRKSRVSDISGLSANSRSSSTSASSAGYLADTGSSGASGISSEGSSKRSRLSIMPEAEIPHHNVHSPLPSVAKAILERSHSGGAMVKAQLEMLKKKEEQEESEQAKQKEVTLEKVPEECTPTNVESDLNTSNAKVELFVDCMVFAKFQERTRVSFWPAKITKIDKEEDDPTADKIEVKFLEDNVKRVLNTEDVIPVTSLEKSHQVNAYVDKKRVNYKTGTLVSHPDLTQEVSYQLKFEPTPGLASVDDKLVVFTDVFLSLDQANQVKKNLGGLWNTPKVSKTGADINLDNVLGSSRRRATRSTSEMASPSTSTASRMSSPRTPASRRKKGGANVETSAVETEVENEDAGKATLTKKRNPRRKILATTDEEQEAPAPPTTSAKRGRKSKVSMSDKGSLFKGMTFILTSSKTPSSLEVLELMDTETESELDRSTSEDIRPTSSQGFNRSEVAKKIRENGGTVLDSFPGAKRAIPKDLIILTDKCCRTMTFLMGIAYGFMRINYHWVNHSLGEGRLMDRNNYVVPVGYSKIKEAEVENHEVKVKLTGLMKNANVLLASKDETFCEDWKPLLTRLGANVCSRTKGKIDRSLPKIDVLIADEGSNVPEGLVKDARSKDVPVVGTEWVIQCLINGSLVSKTSFILP